MEKSGSPWNEEEENFMRKNYSHMSNREIARALGRSPKAVERKGMSMDLSKADGYDSNVGRVLTPAESVLSILKKEKFPLSKSEILKRIGYELSGVKFARLIREIEDDGYDVKHIVGGSDEYFGLVRSGGVEHDSYYKFQGEIETPVLMTGDWHVGNKLHSALAFEKLLESIEENSVATVMIDGDLIEGKGVHREEAMALKYPDIDYQIDLVEKMLEEIPKCVKKIGIVIGNHETKIKGDIRVGFDATKTIARRNDRASYYGQVANLRLNGEWDYQMMHSSGSVGYALSYKGQRIRDLMIQRPHILHLGHIHQPYDAPRPHVDGGSNIIVSASLKREGGWELQKGWTSIVGWWILHRWSLTGKLLEEFRPRVF